MTRRPISIALLAVLLSLIFSFIAVPIFQGSLNIQFDPDRHRELGWSIAQGRGLEYANSDFPATDRGPGYPAFLAVIFLLAGGISLPALQIAQALLHGVTTLIVYRTARKLYPERKALIAQFLCAVYPVLLWFTARIWVETFMTFLLALIVFCLVSLYEKPTVTRCLLTGVIFAAAVLTKSVLLLFPIILLALFIKDWGKAGLYRGLTIILVIILLVAPWTIRNYDVTGLFIPVHTTLGINLVEGDVIGSDLLKMPFGEYPLWQAGARIADSIAHGWENPEISFVADRILTHASLQHYASNPVFWLKRCLFNLCTLMYLGDSMLKSIVLFLFLFPLVVFAFRGFIKGWRDKTLHVLGWMLLYYLLVHAVIYGKGRFLAPMVPIMILLAVGNDVWGRSGQKTMTDDQ